MFHLCRKDISYVPEKAMPRFSVNSLSESHDLAKERDLATVRSSAVSLSSSLSLCPSKRRQPKHSCAVTLERCLTGVGVETINWICEKQKFTTHIGLC